MAVGALSDSPAPEFAHFLDADPIPTFLTSISLTECIEFGILVRNKAFSSIQGLENLITADASASLQFRAWAQAVLNWRETYNFGGQTWTAFSIQGRWKVIRAQKKHDADVADITLEHGIQGTEVLTKRSSERPNVVDESATAAVQSRDERLIPTRLESMQRMMDMSDVGVFEYHPSGILMRANRSWYKLSLHPTDRETHVDFSFMDLVYPPDIPLVMSQWNSLSQGTPVTFEMRWKAPGFGKPGASDEEQFQWVLSACVPVIDDEGTVTSIAGNTIDISAQKKVQRDAIQQAEALQRARTSEQKFARFAELAPVGIYIFDPTKGMQYCNNQFFELTGRPQTEPSEVDYSSLVYPEDLPIVEAAWKVLLEDKKPAQTMFRLQKKWKDGEGNTRQVWAQGSSYPECDAEGNIVSILGTMTDITRFKWAEDVQRTRVEEALEAKRQQENFIDMTSHEMRNPLSAVIQSADSSIQGLTDISALIAELLPDKLNKAHMRLNKEILSCLEALQTIVSCSMHQKRIIDDVLTLSKLDSNLIQISPMKVKPAIVVADAVRMCELECSKEEIELRFREDQSLSSNGAEWVFMDPSRLLQILLNLLTNAIKFSRDRPVKQIYVTLGASLEILPEKWNGITFAATRTVSTTYMNEEEWGHGPTAYIWLTVQDTGCGLTEEEQGKLFARFSQATPRTHVQYGGSGLGLFISKSLTELQSGCIGVHSEAGVGSTFAFYIGVKIATPPSLTTIMGLRRPDYDRTLSIEKRIIAANYSILLVEDNLVNQKVLTRQLQKLGCNVHVAGHGEEALEYLKTTQLWHTQSLAGNKISIVLMDIEMPVMDGLTCVRRIRELQLSGELTAHVPVLAVSANARGEQVRQALDAGMDDSISKPFRIPDLLPKLESLARTTE
ncbi:hypothetical protein BT63DRAFT_484198 [Microthyrium microscopicum]|uniref:Histidine kinase HHK8p n=1 Tax=Microthyrium microscopicum TaxID=703497 RepID=A0A6A6TWX5_9PEZI|nr:hypothetical protein BT63DRAFT_484198 [Microthyrium microscopicum]